MSVYHESVAGRMGMSQRCRFDRSLSSSCSIRTDASLGIASLVAVYPHAPSLTSEAHHPG
jgi:hypothetical protein